ncbi:hypothetical protein L2E82_02215 [Cichorium intybus]|uniref:Uncharacterized protein n=1 Tax=Cichorium intybus TaxID=13427 RepID=A0ACB9H109_CICIN|nr:hypothetical protein L2E82_02215 [Cichorium intybus]
MLLPSHYLHHLASPSSSFLQSTPSFASSPAFLRRHLLLHSSTTVVPPPPRPSAEAPAERQRMVMNREDVAAYIQKQNQEIERFIGLQANNLGLHPRQVAIWFQNKRAQSKSRQIEQENNTLKHNYETLATKSESLKKVNQALLNQLEMLINAAERNGENTSSECVLDIKTESLHKRSLRSRKAAGISVISGSVCCEDHFGWRGRWCIYFQLPQKPISISAD